MKRVVSYLRVSTDEQDTRRQAEQIEQYCVEHHYLIVKVISEKISGAKSDRAGKIELLTLDNSVADMVVISESSRLSRDSNYLQLLNSVNDLLENGLDVYFLNNNKLYRSGNNLELTDIILLAVEAKANADERLNIKARLHSGRQSKAKQGCFVGHKVAYGYKIIPNPLKIKDSREHGKSLYVIDESVKGNVQMVFNLVANKGYSIRKVCKYLNSLGIYKNGKPWTYSTLSNVITNPLYCGEYSFSGTIYPMPAIVSKELFLKCQQVRHDNILIIDKSTVNFNILKGIAKCPCGANLTIKQSGEHNYYICAKQRSSYVDLECKNGTIQKELLEKLIRKSVDSFIFGKNEYERKTDTSLIELEKVLALFEKSAVAKDNTLIEIKQKAKNLLDALSESNNRDVRELISGQIEILKVEEHNIDNEILELSREIHRVKFEIKKLSTEIKGIDINNYSKDELREFYRTVLGNVVYYKHSPFKGFLVITYTNGFVDIYTVQTKPVTTVYQLPQNCLFNPESRKVIAEFYNTSPDEFTIPAKESKELDFKQVLKSFGNQLSFIKLED